MSLVFLFPGQSSRYPGMLDKLVDLHAPNAEVLEQASDILDWDLAHQFSVDNTEAFSRNVDVQVGVFLANHMFLRRLQAEGIDADTSMGLSLGEYSHLVHIGALGFEDALRLVYARGEAYDNGPRGWMASIQPIDLEELQTVLADINAKGDLGVVEAVNLNSPRQHVISGDQAAVEAAMAVLEDEHYVQPVVIEKQVPMHSTKFEPVGATFRESLEAAAFMPPRKPYVPNRLGETLKDPSREQFVNLLAEHIYQPVLWRKSIDHVLERDPDAVFVEVGPRSVLHNLLHRKWVRNRKFHTDSREETAAHLDGVLTQLRELTHGVVAEPRFSAG